MKLSVKLAYSQLKTNRSRTMWTWMGIILSTALITAVCSFAASGNAMAVNFFGEAYGDYGGMFTSLLLIPAGILSVIIISMSVVVISNAFRVSAGERTAQFGILKSVGATKQNIIAAVMCESILLCAAGIPVGIMMGLALAFVGVQVANNFLEEINSLVNMMMNEFIIVIDFVVAWQALIAAALISFGTVLFSAWIPARKAARIAAIDSIRGVGEVKIEVKELRTSRLMEQVFGFEGTLAAKNMKRNKRNFRASVVSLSIGIVLFINLSALSEQAGLLEDMMYPELDAAVMVDYISSRSVGINETTGREESIITVPIDSKMGDIVTGKLREYEDTVIFGIGDDMETYDAIVPREKISTQMMETMKNQYQEESSGYRLSAEILTADYENYAILCERAGVPIGSNILLNHYSYNDNGRAVVFAPFSYEGQTLQLIKADDSIYEITIHGALTQEDIPNEFFAPNTNIVRVIVPKGDMRGYTWYAEPADIDGFMDYANVIMGEMFPRGQESSYMELGFTTRVFMREDYMKVMNIAIVLATVFIYSFVALLTLIGLTNVVSTMSANVRMRSREFAVLQSVGMTHSGLKRMINLESMMCSARSLIIGLPIAIVLTYFINLPIRSAFPIPYELPWAAAAWCIAVVYGITWITMRCCVVQLRRKNVMESIRTER